RVSGGPAVATGEVAASGGAVGATVEADATVPGDASAVLGCPALRLGTGDALGEICAVDADFPGASRCTLRINFITEKPTTNTSTPKMSGIGEMRSGPAVGAGRRRRRSEEHTSELQSLAYLVCRLLLEKKKR